MDCKHSQLLITLRIASATKLKLCEITGVCQKREDRNFCDVASGRTYCHGIYTQHVGKKSNNQWNSIHTIYRIGRVCPKHFVSTVKSNSPDWVRSSSKEKLFFYCSVDGHSYRRRRAVLTAGEVFLIWIFSITKLNKKRCKVRTRDYSTDQVRIRVIGHCSINHHATYTNIEHIYWRTCSVIGTSSLYSPQRKTVIRRT